MTINTDNYTIARMKKILASILLVLPFMIASCGGSVKTAGLSLVEFSTEDFAGSGNCAVCHIDLEDQIGNYVSIGTHWRSTMMANAAKDPFWQAKVASEVARNPHLKEVIEEKCASCHMPMAYTQAEVRDGSAMIFDTGLANTSNPLNPAAMDGVSCTLCHQIVDPVLGKYTVDTSTEPPDRLIYGPYKDPEQSLMISTSQFTPVYGEYITNSVLCGTCH
ncbi:MAG: multiheme c-type cytochrome [Dehalococcoidales bacterium]